MHRKWMLKGGGCLTQVNATTGLTVSQMLFLNKEYHSFVNFYWLNVYYIIAGVTYMYDQIALQFKF